MTKQPSEQSREQIDPVITDAVIHVRDRFGSTGLADLIALARDELARARPRSRSLVSWIDVGLAGVASIDSRPVAL